MTPTIEDLVTVAQSAEQPNAMQQDMAQPNKELQRIRGKAILQAIAGMAGGGNPSYMSHYGSQARALPYQQAVRTMPLPEEYEWVRPVLHSVSPSEGVRLLTDLARKPDLDDYERKLQLQQIYKSQYQPMTPEQWADYERKLRLQSQYRPGYQPMTPEQWADYERKLQLQAQYSGEKQMSQQEAKREQEAISAAKDFAKTAYLFKNTWNRKKEQLGKAGAGPIIGKVKEIGANLQIPGLEATAAYDGQVTETALALSRIVTGQNRLVESVFDRLVRSLPDIRDTESYARRKIEQSVRNAYGLLKSMREYGTTDRIRNATDEELKDRNSDINREISSLAPSPLTEEDEQEIQKILKVVFGEESERAPQREEPEQIKRVKTQAEVDALNPGEKFIWTDGKVYKKE